MAPQIAPTQAACNSAVFLCRMVRLQVFHYVTRLATGKRELLQRERVHAGADDYDVLLAVLAQICHRVRVALDIQLGLPEHLASSRIESTEARVVCSGYEHQTAGGRDAAAPTERAGVVHPFGFQFVARTERDVPGDIAGIGV